ncbi:mucin-4-like [Triticum dicoccoides]|uniref:mucin-4-like n=1 Tax=Triticum dicoccoides TaxID=85692 RepID=UPI000E7B2465|nr:mucin-4-like [Triticum dicoccoides]
MAGGKGVQQRTTSGGSQSRPSQDGSQSPAPEERRGRSRSRRGHRGEVVVREIVRETAISGSVPITFPMLMRSNYSEWALIMECNLHAASLWAPMEDDLIERKEDRKAVAALMRATPPEMHGMLAAKASAKEAWEAIRTQRLGSNHVREVNAQKLRADFENIAFKEGELVDDFAMRISSLASQLRALGDTMDDARLVRKFLRVVPSRFAQVAVSIETLLDLSELSVEELTGRLRVVEDRLDDGRESFGGGQLLFSKKWEARKRQGRGGGAQSSGGSIGRGGGRTQGGAGRGAGNDDRDKCRYCSIKGHWARECCKRMADEDAAAAANLVEAEEDGGPAMMMACVETMQEGRAPPATMVLASIEAVQEGAAPPATTVSATVKSVREAWSSSSNPLATSVALSPTTTFSGDYDWEEMKTQVWGSHTPETTSPATLVKPVQVGTAKAYPTSSRPNKLVSGGTTTTHMVGHVPTMMLVTSETVQEARHSQVGHNPTTRFSGFCKPVWATRHSSTSLNWEAMKRWSWGGKASTETMATIESVQEAQHSLVGYAATPTRSGSIESVRDARDSVVGHDPTTLVATVETVQEARCSMVGHTAAPTHSGSIESVREARLTIVGGDPTSKSDGKSTKDSATLRGATPVSVASGTTTLGREFPGSAASGTTTPEREFLGSPMSDKSSPGREFPSSVTSDTTTPGREFPGSVTSGTTTPETLTPTSEVVPGQFMSPSTARSDLFDANKNGGDPHRFRSLGGPSRARETIAAPEIKKHEQGIRAAEKADIPTKALGCVEFQEPHDRSGIIKTLLQV